MTNILRLAVAVIVTKPARPPATAREAEQTPPFCVSYAARSCARRLEPLPATTKDHPVNFRQIKLLAATLLCALALAACSPPAPDTVAAMAKTSMQDILRVDPRFEGSGVEVVKVQLTVDGERKYKGVASIKYKGTVHEVPVNVLVDGLSIKWDTAPDAFSFVPQTKPPQ
jgi:hypothetical protein